MDIQIPKQLYKIIKTFQDNNYEIFIVGGAVRDILMKNTTYDWDMTTNATPDEMLKILPEAYYDIK